MTKENSGLSKVRSNELLVCPFCGNKETERIRSTNFISNAIRINCYGCGAYGPVATSVEHAKKFWNERAK